MIFRPHWLKLFSNWLKYNAKPLLSTKWRQISMKCFHFFEQKFPRICLIKVLIVSVQHLILSIPDYRPISFQWFPHFPIIISVFHGESFWVEMALTFLCVFSCPRGWPVTFDAFLLVLYWSTNEFLFCFTIIYWPAWTF